MDQRRAVALLCLLLAGCEEKRVEPVPASIVTAGRADRGELCVDIGERRACWGEALAGEGCAPGVCPVERTLPSAPRPADGWRCSGMGPTRVCSPRARSLAPWQCDDRACVQLHPRLPDQGEWDCAELDGVVRCTGGHPAAGVPPTPPEDGWLCGARSGADDGARVCVDFTPDVPEPAERDRWRCRFLRREGLSRSCEKTPVAAVRLGSRCIESRACPGGAVCAGGRCLPPWPKPSCYQDDDCGPGRACRFGTCAGGA